MAQHVFWYGTALKVQYGTVVYSVKLTEDNLFEADLRIENLVIPITAESFDYVKHSHRTDDLIAPLEIINMAYVMSLSLYRIASKNCKLTDEAYSNINAIISSIINLKYNSDNALGGY